MKNIKIDYNYDNEEPREVILIGIYKKITIILLLFCSLAYNSGCLIKEFQKTVKLDQILEAGNEALFAKDFDKALEFYDAGLLLSPNEPTFLSNKSIATYSRGTERYNASIRIASEKKSKAAEIDAAKKDLSDAAIYSSDAVKAIKTQSRIELFNFGSHEDVKLNVLQNHAEAMRLVAVVVDKTKADAALEAIHEYISFEPNQQKKIIGRLAAGKMLTDTYNGNRAVAEYKKVFEVNPDDTEAVLGMGLALAQSGQADDFREAKSLLQRFVNQAPANHPSIATAEEILNSMPPDKIKP